MIVPAPTDSSFMVDHDILCDMLMDKYGTLTPPLSATSTHLWPSKWLETLYVITTLTLDNSLVEDHDILCDILMDKYGTLTPSSATSTHLWPSKWLETLYVITTLTLDNSLVEDHDILCDMLMDKYGTLTPPHLRLPPIYDPLSDWKHCMWSWHSPWIIL